jgi:molybdopterin-guanine dinucleotide biosynthesis protein A
VIDRTENITGFVLCGGKSSRMGVDKGMMVFQGVPMICHVISALKKCVTRIVVLSNNPDYESFGYAVYTDLVKDAGPAGGIMTGLTKTETERNFFVGCDMPFMSPEIIGRIVSHQTSADVVVPQRGGQIEPLCGMYMRRCLPVFEHMIASGVLSLHDIINECNVHCIELEKCHSTEKVFANVNTTEDYLTALSC